MNGQNSPCYGCEDRHVGCHADCAKYVEYRDNCDAYRELVYRNKGKYVEATRFYMDSPRPRVTNTASYKKYGHR